MIHSSKVLNLLLKYGIICIIISGFLNKIVISTTFTSKAFVNSPKIRFQNFNIVKRPKKVNNSPYKFLLSSLEELESKESRFAEVEQKCKSRFLSECIERSLISQTTDFLKLDGFLEEYEKTNFNNSLFSSVYYGIDCTNDFIHEGTLMQLMFLRRFLSQRFNVVLVIGGGTTLVGDPSYKLRRIRKDPFYFSELIAPGKKEDLDTSNEEAIKSIAIKVLSMPINVNGEIIMPQVRQVTECDSDLDLSSEMCEPYKIFVLNNRDLYKRVNLMEYMETVGRNMKVGRMLSKDCIKMRLVDKDREDGRTSVNMYLSELMYMSLQAMDFIYLAQKFNCRIQLGGNDQMGNIVSGIELGDSLSLPILFGITTPLLKDKFGEKISKSGMNCFLKIKKETSPHVFWSHFRTLEDSNVENYLKWFTKVPLEKIRESISEHYNTAKTLLADEITGLLYGRQVVELIHKFCLSKHFDDLEPFLKNSKTDLKEFEDFVNFTKSVPHVVLSEEKLKQGVYLTQVLDSVRVPQFSNMSFYPNKKFIAEGTCKVNGQAVGDTSYKLTVRDVVKLTSGDNSYRYIAIELGKRKLYFVIVS